MVDPGNGLPYKKPMRIASTVDLSILGRKCDKQHSHQRVEGCVDCGVRKGTRRSQISGEYSRELCRAWVACTQAAIGVQTGASVLSFQGVGRTVTGVVIEAVCQKNEGDFCHPYYNTN